MLRVGLAAGSLGRALDIKKANLELVEATVKGKQKLLEISASLQTSFRDRF